MENELMPADFFVLRHILLNWLEQPQLLILSMVINWQKWQRYPCILGLGEKSDFKIKTAPLGFGQEI